MVAVMSNDVEALVEPVVCAFTEVDVDAVTGVDEVVAEAALEAGVEIVAEGLVDGPVPTGTFWRYCRGRRAFSISVAFDEMARRRRDT